MYWGWHESRLHGAGTALVVCISLDVVEGFQMNKAALPSQVTAAYGEQLSFLPTPELSVKWPKHTTVAGLVLSELLHGSFIDHQDLIDGVSSWRLAAYINKLKNDGWPIQAFEKPAPSEHCPTRCIALYALSPAVIAQVQEMRGAA